MTTVYNFSAGPAVLLQGCIRTSTSGTFKLQRYRNVRDGIESPLILLR